jgi:hypothetical protein
MSIALDGLKGADGDVRAPSILISGVDEHARGVRTEKGESMEGPLRGCLAGAAAYWWGGGCLTMIVVFIIVYVLLGHVKC